jgi:2,3-bisphosphoglycerate-independent phosphoglycerate mutase
MHMRVTINFRGRSIQKNITRELIAADATLSPLDAALDSIQEISRFVVEATHGTNYDFMAITFSQMDTLAHRAAFDDLVTVIEKIDNRLQIMVEAITAAGGVACIVGSHGFAERLIDPSSGTVTTSHSLNPVIFSIVGKQFEGYNLGWPEAIGGDLSLLSPIGTLVDVAPTILSLAALNIPAEMTGHNLIP